MFLTISKLVAIDAVTISGSIVDVSGNPLPGSNVLLINTSNGGAADTEGFYSITIPTNLISDNNANIRASFIGFRSITNPITFSGKKDIIVNFVLPQDVLGMEAVVVTGLGGTEEKKKLGVLIESVKP